MIDSVLKGIGNSRFLKSAVPDGTSWADALAMLQAGTFPIDFNGINTEGFQQVGTPLNKANLLKDATAAQIGLPPSTTPDGMFQALGNTGELHVWRKTVKNAADVPAGYTLGAAQEVELIKGKNNSGSAIAYRTITVSYSASITVSDDGKTITLVSPSTATIRSDYPAEADAIKGKFFKITQYQSTYVDVPRGVNFVPSSATFDNVYPNSNGWTSLTCSAMQTVTGYAKVPAGTTTTYPVSTNPNAYQEGSDAKPAGYTLGEVVTGLFRINAVYNNTTIYYASSVKVADNGAVTLANQATQGLAAEKDSYNNAKKLAGKFIIADYDHNYCKIPKGVVLFIPANTTISFRQDVPGDEGYGIFFDRYQPVTGYAAIPAGTTIEYLGKLGDKARVQVVSYVGTGTNGDGGETKIPVGFPPKLLVIAIKNISRRTVYISVPGSGTGLYLSADGSSSIYGSIAASVSYVDGEVYMVADYENAQMNSAGETYIAVALG